MRGCLSARIPELAIVFCRTKRGAEKLAKKLHADGIECREIHGNLAQNKRDRVMQGFRKGKFDVLIATDLASAGHRCGRHQPHHQLRHPRRSRGLRSSHRANRRIGAQGKAITFVQRDQGEELTKVENLINMVIPPATLEGFEPRPQPSDWTDFKPGEGPAVESVAKPVISRFERGLRRNGSNHRNRRRPNSFATAKYWQ